MEPLIGPRNRFGTHLGTGNQQFQQVSQEKAEHAKGPNWSQAKLWSTFGVRRRVSLAGGEVGGDRLVVMWFMD